LGTKIELPSEKPLRNWLIISSLTAFSTGTLFMLLLTTPLVVFEGNFVSGSVAIAWYDLRNYGEPVYHPGLSSIPFLSIPAFCASSFSILVSCLVVYKVWKRNTVSHVLVEMLIGALEVCVIFIGVFFSLRLDVIHATSAIPTEVGGVNSAGHLVISGSIRRETFPSILIGQFYPLVILGVLLSTIALILGYEIAKFIPNRAEKNR